MPSKRKPVVRAWRGKDGMERLRVGRCYWMRLCHAWGWEGTYADDHRRNIALKRNGYKELSRTEANRLNAARVRAMGRKP